MRLLSYINILNIVFLKLPNYLARISHASIKSVIVAIHTPLFAGMWYLLWINSGNIGYYSTQFDDKVIALVTCFLASMWFNVVYEIMIPNIIDQIKKQL